MSAIDPGAIPVWTDSLDWNRVLLGTTILAGTAEVEDVSSEIEVEHKKAKGSEKPTSKDNGNKVGEFRILLQLTENDWQPFVESLKDWHPRRLGRERAPLLIIHPLVNALGISQVRVIGVKFPKSPSARDGLRVAITVAEWFDKPVGVKTSKKTTKSPYNDEFLVDPATRSSQFNNAITNFPNLDSGKNPANDLTDLHLKQPQEQEQIFRDRVFGDGQPLQL